MNSPWPILEDVPAHSAAAAEWKRHLGGSFKAASDAFLQTTKRKASSVRCPHTDVCAHQIKARGNGFVGKCKDDDGPGCDDITLTADEAEVLEVNLKRLGAAMAGALKCPAKDEQLGLDRTRQIASLGSAPLPILLTVQHDADGFSNVVARLAARWPKGFILLAPTSRFCTATATEMLDRAKAGFFDMETHVELLENGRLHAPKTGAELFAAYLPEMKDIVSESDKALVFRLFSELLGMGTTLKASPARVFDLMVFKKMTKAETAMECDCAASLITKRVAMIEGHFRMPIENLCAFADDLKERQSTVKGDRYARKKQGAAAEEPQQYKDDDDSPPSEEYRYEEGNAED